MKMEATVSLETKIAINLNQTNLCL